MARKTPAQIKAYFETGDTPTQAQFEEFIDNSVPTYKRYKALLTQIGTNVPVATVLENTLGNVTFNRDGVGDYYLNCTGAFADENKIITLEVVQGSKKLIFIYTNSDSIEFMVMVNGLCQDGFTNIPITIEVYD